MAKARTRRRRPRFHELPKHAQRSLYIRFKNRIHAAPLAYRGRFYSFDVIDGSPGSVDFVFLGSKAPVFYNATLHTARMAYREAIEDAAWEASFERQPMSALESGPITERIPGTERFRFIEREPERFVALDGLTRAEWTAGEAAAIAASGTVTVREGWTLHHDYAMGIGLEAVVDEESLTFAVIGAFIERFMKTEAEWTGSTELRYAWRDGSVNVTRRLP